MNKTFILLTVPTMTTAKHTCK